MAAAGRLATSAEEAWPQARTPRWCTQRTVAHQAAPIEHLGFGLLAGHGGEILAERSRWSRWEDFTPGFTGATGPDSSGRVCLHLGEQPSRPLWQGTSPWEAAQQVTSNPVCSVCSGRRSAG